MKTIKYTIQFHSYWHCGSGLAAGAGVDALVVKDAKGLPFVPGKTIKGLLREAMEELHTFDTESNKYSNEDFVALFGYFDEDTKEHTAAKAFFGNAELANDEQKAIINEELQEHLYKAFSSTAIDATKGIAKEHSLRKIEVVVPCALYGEIYEVPDNIAEELTRAMGFIKTMGTNRNRGLGRCTISIDKVEDTSSKNEERITLTKPLKYKVELLTDIILNQKAATEGANTTLDFIPGSCFLGVVAREIYKEDNKQSLTIFHSGKVRFGDAHPANGKVRTLRVPAMMMHPKLNKEEYYISAAIHPKDDEAEKKLRELQLKQCRTGFYDFSQNPALEVEAETSFAIKSAYDKENRTSKKNAMYGYEALRKGLTLYFEVEVDDEALEETIGKALVGTKHIGRSRSAQYGLVEIQPYGFQAIDATKCPSKNEIYVYADGRLIFLNNNGLPTFRPTAKDLGIENGKIDWEKSQVRTFQYAPWNATRQGFDTDRCGIEKGSVFVVKCTGDTPTLSPRYVGSYQNEGFGKVLYNPAFLEAETNDQYGKAVYQLKKKEKEEGQETNTAATATMAKEPDLLNYLRLEKKETDITSNIYEKVEEWVVKNSGLFASKEFASQWGTIRALASIRKTNKTVWDMLFEKENGYLEHGIAKEKWDEGGRKKKLQEFINGLPENMDNEDVRLAVVNLAAEMAKRCRK